MGIVSTDWGPNWDALDPEFEEVDEDELDYIENYDPFPERLHTVEEAIALAEEAQAARRVEVEVVKHLPGLHDQKRHGRRFNLTGISSFMARLADPDGGFTYNIRTASEPSRGYVVPHGKEFRNGKASEEIKGNVVSARTQRDLIKFQRTRSRYWDDPDNHLGGWHDPDDGYIYYDVAIVVRDEEEAAELTREYGHRRYFDLEKGQSVEVNKSAKSKPAELAIVPVQADYAETARDFFRALFGPDITFEPLDTPPPKKRNIRRGNRVISIVDGKPKGTRHFRE